MFHKPKGQFSFKASHRIVGIWFLKAFCAIFQTVYFQCHLLFAVPSHWQWHFTTSIIGFHRRLSRDLDLCLWPASNTLIIIVDASNARSARTCLQPSEDAPCTARSIRLSPETPAVVINRYRLTAALHGFIIASARSHRIIFKFINSLLVLVISRCWDPLVVFFHRGPVSAYLLHKFFKNGLPWKYMRDATTIRATAIWPVNSTRWRSAVPFDAYMWLALVIMISATIKTRRSATIATMLQPHHLLGLWFVKVCLIFNALTSRYTLHVIMLNFLHFRPESAASKFLRLPRVINTTSVRVCEPLIEPPSFSINEFKEQSRIRRDTES